MWKNVDVKCISSLFQSIEINEEKCVEMELESNVKIGDIVTLHEYEETESFYTGEEKAGIVRYIKDYPLCSLGLLKTVGIEFIEYDTGI